MVEGYLVLLGLVALERVFELRRSRRNIAWAFARGGLEYGGGHYGPMVALHTALLVGAPLEVLVAGRPFIPWLGGGMLLLALAAQMLRYSAIAALGPHWSVRVVVVPGARLVRRGPYRFVRHPNYLAVVAEGVAIPMIHTAYLTAIVFSALNLVLLTVRIRCEEQALVQNCIDPLSDRR